MSSATLTPGANPTDSSPKQLTTKKAARLLNDDRIVTLLVELELGAYEGEPGHYYLGFTDPEVHAHDRWLWANEPRRVQVSTTGAPLLVGGWVESHSHLAALPDIGDMVNPNAIKSTLAYYQHLVGEVRMRLLLREGRVVGPTEVLAALTVINSADVNDLVEVDYSLTPREMHELVHHTAQFVAAHPDHAGVPRQNLLAVYGLADPYRAVRAGRESE